MPRKPLRNHIHLDSHQSLVASLSRRNGQKLLWSAVVSGEEITTLIGFQLTGFGQSHLGCGGSAVFGNTLDTSLDAYVQARANFPLES